MKDDDSIQRLSLKRYNCLIKGHPDEGLMQYAGKRIRYALIVLEMMNRKPAEILMTEYSYLAFNSKGRLDTSEREKAARLVMDSIEPIDFEQKSKELIDVKHKFAKRRYDDRYIWEPSPETENAIRKAIFG